jgi:hypothetical protein
VVSPPLPFPPEWLEPPAPSVGEKLGGALVQAPQADATMQSNSPPTPLCVPLPRLFAKNHLAERERNRSLADDGAAVYPMAYSSEASWGAREKVTCPWLLATAVIDWPTSERLVSEQRERRRQSGGRRRSDGGIWSDGI